MERTREFLRERQVELIICGLVFGLAILFFAPRIFITVKAGEAAVLYRPFLGGTVRGKVYGEGLHVLWPWDHLWIYNVRIQEIRRAVEVLDNSGLQYRVNVSIRYRPEYNALGVLHQTVGPDYAEKVVVPEVEGVLRSVAGRMNVRGFYSGEQDVLAKIVNQSLSATDEKFIIVDDLIVRSIELPAPIQAAIEKKREEEQLAEAYEYRIQREEQEAKRKVIEAGGTKQANEILAASLSPDILKWKGIEATTALSTSTNAKVIVIGNGSQGLPIILGSDK